MKALACLLAVACAAPLAHAGDGVATTVRAGASHEHLDNGSPGWRETGAGVQFGFAPRQILDLSLARTSRFGLHDNQFAASYSTPLLDGLTATIDANASDTHRVLARHALGGELQYEFAKGWLAHGGARSTRYATATVNQALVTLER
jgi:YaiO family outer membrane protein